MLEFILMLSNVVLIVMLWYVMLFLYHVSLMLYCIVIFFISRKPEEPDTDDRRPKSPVVRGVGVDSDTKIRNDIQSSYTVRNHF